MKKILLFLFTVLLALSTTAQTIGDTTTLRSAINTDIVPNASGGITATKLNRILNGVMNSMSRQTLVDHPLTIKRGALKDTFSVDYASGAGDGVITAANFTKFDKSWGPDGNFLSAGGFIGTLNYQPIPFKVNSVEKMRLTSTGLGIGTFTPGHLLDVAGVIRGQSDALINTLTIGLGGGGIYDNTAIGYQALYGGTGGNHNTAIGYQALKAITGGYENTAVGYLAGYQLSTSAQENVLIGAYSMYNTTGTPFKNVAIGKNSFPKVTGDNNTGMGTNVGLNLTSGAKNTLIGAGAGASLTTGSNNIIIGSSVSGIDVSSASVSNELNIGGWIKGTAGAIEIPGSLKYYLALNTQTASYTLVLGDAGKNVEMNVGSANNLTVPPNGTVAFPIGTQIIITQLGAGQTTIVAGSGVTILSSGGKLKIADQYSGATLIKRNTNEWVLFGNLSL